MLEYLWQWKDCNFSIEQNSLIHNMRETSKRHKISYVKNVGMRKIIEPRPVEIVSQV